MLAELTRSKCMGDLSVRLRKYFRNPEATKWRFLWVYLKCVRLKNSLFGLIEPTEWI